VLKQIGGSRVRYLAMKNLVLGLLALLVVGVPLPSSAQTPVVVELFTSEGCSSCPPADALLLQLSQQKSGVPLILLGEHVDYWNYIGWTDRFSAKQFSERQGEYAKALHASVYTPQMVIDGREQFVGNDAAEVQKRIAAETSLSKAAKVSLTWEGNNRLRVSVQSPQQAKASVLLAITEDGLSTEVGKGENGGKTLHHAAVVRSLRQIAEVRDGKYEGSIDIQVPADWSPNRLKAVVLVQVPSNMSIVGAGQLRFAL
jgi:hypothetical protein